MDVSDYIRKYGLDHLSTRLGIRVFRHPHLPLIGLKYDQIKSPRNHPIADQCRDLVIEDGSYKVVARPFKRFYNVGEYECLWKEFVWDSASVVTKEDGSLIILYHYNGEWHVNTSGSFGLSCIDGTDTSTCPAITWRDLFWSTASGIKIKKRFNPDFTFMFELCTPYNKVVRTYESQLFLTGICHTETGRELCEEDLDDFAKKFKAQRPRTWNFGSHDELTTKLSEISATDPTFEGFVLRDNNRRWKVKSRTYVAIHQLKDNGNIFNPRRMLELVLNGEINEVMAVLPETRQAASEMSEGLACLTKTLMAVWSEARHIPAQKDFADAVKDAPLFNVLFALRKKYGRFAGEKELLSLVREQRTDTILEAINCKKK